VTARRLTRLLWCCCLAAGLLAQTAAAARAHAPRAAAHRRAHAAIVGGSEASIAQAPWQVEVTTEVKLGEAASERHCGGAILSETEIVTAAHCVYDQETEGPVQASQVTVLAGVSDYLSEEAVAQKPPVSSVQVHPYYEPDAIAGEESVPDDVALITLSKPLELGAAVQAIGRAAGAPAEGASLIETGFGEQLPPEPANGKLYSLGMTLAYSRECGGDYNAVFACAGDAAGAVCFGDSGSGLTVPGAPTQLLGVTDTTSGGEEPCRRGTLGGFADVAAAEIGDFLAGSSSPPVAPYGHGAVIRGVLRTGRSLACEPGTWSDVRSVSGHGGDSALVGGEGITFAYAFIDDATHAVLQRGASAAYALSAADIGRSIFCEVWASSAGGTGVGRTPPLGPIEPPPVEEHPTGGAPGTLPPPAAGGVAGSQASAAPELSAVTLAASRIAVSAGARSALVKLRCTGAGRCQGTLELIVSRRSGRSVRRLVIGQASFSIPASRTSAIAVTLAGSGRAILHGVRHGLAARLSLLGSATLPKSLVLKPVELLAPARR